MRIMVTTTAITTTMIMRPAIDRDDRVGGGDGRQGEQCDEGSDNEAAPVHGFDGQT